MWSGFFIQHKLVMRIYDRLNIWHASVTDFECVFVKKFSQWVVFIEALVDSFKELLADVGGYVRTVGWIIPGDVSAFSSLWFLLGWLVKF